MAWMRCRSCLTLFAVGLLRCPHCQAVSELYARPDHEDDQEEQMPKITIAGASNALEEREPGAEVATGSAAEETTEAPESTGADEAQESETEQGDADGAAANEPETPASPAPKKRAAAKKSAPQA